MAKIKSFDRTTCRLIGSKVEEVLNKLGDELGVKFSYKGGTYGDTNLTMKIEVATVSSDGVINSREAESFKQLAHFYGLKEEDLNAPIMVRGEKYIITGLKARSGKFPILVKRERDGQGFKLPVESVVKALGR